MTHFPGLLGPALAAHLTSALVGGFGFGNCAGSLVLEWRRPRVPSRLWAGGATSNG